MDRAVRALADARQQAGPRHLWLTEDDYCRELVAALEREGVLADVAEREAREKAEERPDYEQVVTDILVALGDRLDLRDGPDVDDARDAVMSELLAYFGPDRNPED